MLGIIPAYAGSTYSHECELPDRQDHPRIRGEHGCQAILVDSDFGSSPHTRGALAVDDVEERMLRIIPAYAGSTSGMSSFSCRDWDHPRIRGEHCVRESVPRTVQGSSPHTRGALLQVRGGGDGLRIIPAYAGSTRPIRTAPRRCPRIIPAYAGSTRRGLHPGQPPVGSSPHTRGARRIGPRQRRRSGIIPAYAGSTQNLRQHGAREQDHPRIRGEHFFPTFNRIFPAGSSPHTRGALNTLIRIGRDPGIIPAYAGSTGLRAL